MTMKEKLQIHTEIEQENQKKIQKWIRRNAVKDNYSKQCRKGSYESAYDLLRLLRNGSVTLGLDDASAETEIILDGIGFKPYYSRNYCSATYRL